jgi:hypothetical protein
MAEVRLALHEAAGPLPMVCMYCGKRATMVVTVHMWWHPSWVSALRFLGWIPYWIVANMLTKYAMLTCPLCNKHKWYWYVRPVIVVGSMLLFLAVAVSGLMITLDMGRPAQDTALAVVGIGTLVLIFVWLVIVIIADSTGIRATEITHREICIQGVSDEFAEAVGDPDLARPARKKKRRPAVEADDDDEPRPRKKRSRDTEDDDPRPRKKRPADDSIEAD